jgi:hypothetical protein
MTQKTRSQPPNKLNKDLLAIGMILLVSSFFCFYLSSRFNWDYVTTQEKTVNIGYPSAIRNYGFGDSYVYNVPFNHFHISGFGVGIGMQHNDYLTVKCSSADSQQTVYAVLVDLTAVNDKAFSYGLGSLTYTSPSDYESAVIYLAIPSNQTTTNATVTVTFTFNHYEKPQWVIFGIGVALSLLAAIPIFKSKK